MTIERRQFRLKHQSVSVAEGKITYRVVFAALVAAAGVAVELRGAPGTIVRVVKVHFALPSVVQNPLVLTKNSAAAVGGTSTTPQPVPLDSDDEDALAVVRLYTVAPAAGALVGNVYEADHAITAVLFETFGETPNAQGLVLRGVDEALTIVLSAGATIDGYIEWTEE